jgi:O-antigen/teichoic acid export membrane protein
MGFLYYMVTHPGDWLCRLGAWDCFMGMLPTLIIAIRSYFIFPECRFEMSHLRSWKDICRLATFTGWYAFGILGNLVRGQSLSLMVNKFLGAADNAAAGIAGSLAGKTRVLSGSLRSSFAPAITNAYGAGDIQRMTVLFYAICKFSAMLTLLVAVPVCVESREIMVLWLKTPPPAASGLMIVVSISIVLEHLTMGHWMVISAKGQVALYQFLVGICFCMSFPVGYLFLKCGYGVYSVGYTLVITYVGAVLLRLWTVKRLFGISPRKWLCRIFVPLLATSALSGAAGWCARMFLDASLARVAVAALLAEIVFVPLAWFWVLDRSEREWIVNVAKRRLSGFHR